MRKLLLSALLCAAALIAWAQPEPTVANGHYGPADRNVFDLWVAKTPGPAPLAIFVHGGGFVGGDKDKINKADLEKLLDAGISVAAINYRYSPGLPEGALTSMKDSKYALQYLRYHAPEWNIDPTRVAMWGGSAGAGTSLWLGFHDDMADPTAPDPVLRESTRLTAFCALAPQATYDFMQWPAFFGMDVSKIDLNDQMIKSMAGQVLVFYNMKTPEDILTPRVTALRKEVDMLGMMTPDDPPFMAASNLSGELPPTSQGHMIHHPIHVKVLADRAAQVGVECVAVAPGLGLNSKISVVDFFRSKLLAR